MTRLRPWTVRPATLDDAEAIETVRIATSKACFRGIISDEFLDSLAVTPSRIKRYRKAIEDDERSVLVVGTSGTEVIGMGVAEPLGEAEETAAVAEVHAIYVLPAWQRCGVGRALLKSVTDGLRSRGYRDAVLWAPRELQATRSFYEASGWTFDGTEDTFDWHGLVHIVRYVRDLTASA